MEVSALLKETRAARTTGKSLGTIIASIDGSYCIASINETSFYPLEEEIAQAENYWVIKDDCTNVHKTTSGYIAIDGRAIRSMVMSYRNYFINIPSALKAISALSEASINFKKFKALDNKSVDFCSFSFESSWTPVKHEVFKIDEKISIVRLVKKANEFDQKNRHVKSLDIIFDEILQLINIKDYNKIDSIIEEFIMHTFSLKVCIGFLTITKAIKQELIFRSKLYSYSLDSAYSYGYNKENAELLLDELE